MCVWGGGSIWIRPSAGGEGGFSVVAKHLLIQRSHQRDGNLAEQQELKAGDFEYTKTE